MKIDLRKYELGKHYNFEEDVDFSSHIFSTSYRIRKITSCHVKVDLLQYEYITTLTLFIKGEVVGACSYTNEDVVLPYKVKEIMTFSSEEGVADYLIENDLIDLDPYLFSLIDNAVPLNIVKKGAKLPESGNGYEVLTEEEYLKKKKEKKDARWSALDDLDI